MYDILRYLRDPTDPISVALWILVCLISIIILVMYGVKLLALFTSIMGALLAVASYILGTIAECLIIASKILSSKRSTVSRIRVTGINERNVTNGNIPSRQGRRSKL